MQLWRHSWKVWLHVLCLPQIIWVFSYTNRGHLTHEFDLFRDGAHNSNYLYVKTKWNAINLLGPLKIINQIFLCYMVLKAIECTPVNWCFWVSCSGFTSEIRLEDADRGERLKWITESYWLIWFQSALFHPPFQDVSKRVRQMPLNSPVTHCWKFYWVFCLNGKFCKITENTNVSTMLMLLLRANCFKWMSETWDAWGILQSSLWRSLRQWWGILSYLKLITRVLGLNSFLKNLLVGDTYISRYHFQLLFVLKND